MPERNSLTINRGEQWKQQKPRVHGNLNQMSVIVSAGRDDQNGVYMTTFFGRSSFVHIAGRSSILPKAAMAILKLLNCKTSLTISRGSDEKDNLIIELFSFVFNI